MLYIPYEQACTEAQRVLLNAGFSEEQAQHLARLFVDNSAEGVYSHGLNRLPRFVETIRLGEVTIGAEPERVRGLGGLEIWDGHFGPGPLCAETAMARAIELAREHGIGCVALRNSNHWMRAGRYGWQAANAGMIGLCWTNTCPNMPAWGATDARLGNNPFVMAIPRSKGHIVLDLAMSQFSYGKLEVSALAGQQMPCDAGYDQNGNLTRDPAAVLESLRILPTGYWKGASMSMLLDLIAAGASLGRTTYVMGQDGGESGPSQIFIAINFRALVDPQKVDELLDEAIDYTLASEPAEGQKIRYPGQNVASIREKNLRDGIPVAEKTWETILAL